MPRPKQRNWWISEEWRLFLASNVITMTFKYIDLYWDMCWTKLLCIKCCKMLLSIIVLNRCTQTFDCHCMFKALGHKTDKTNSFFPWKQKDSILWKRRLKEMIAIINYTFLISNLTGLRPPPVPHTLSSLDRLWFMLRSTSALSRAILCAKQDNKSLSK